MRYLADTVAIVRHLCGHSGLGPQAARILQEADAGLHRVFMSAITLMEVLYLSEAKRVPVRLDELIGFVVGSTNYEMVPVNADMVLASAEVDDVPELHGCILVGTARWLRVPIQSGNRVIQASRHVQKV